MPVFFEHALETWQSGSLSSSSAGNVTASHRSAGGTFAGPGRYPGFPIGFLLLSGNPLDRVPGVGRVPVRVRARARWHREDLEHGADQAESARARLGIVGHDPPPAERGGDQAAYGWISKGRLVVGRDAAGLPVSIPVGYGSGSHTLVVGATGSGKTVSEAWIAGRLIDGVHGAIVIDPKGDRCCARS